MKILRRHAPALLVLAGLAAVGALVVLDEPAYLQLRVALGLKPFVPFLDLHAVASAIACWQGGVDVYAENPCDALGRLHIYSPLWLRLPASWSDAALLRPLGIGFALAFIAALTLLPAAPRGRGEVAMLLAAASPVTAFALERANVDVLIFALVVPGAVLLTGRTGARVAGHGLFLLVGLMKFYPLVLLALLLRERPRVMFALLLVAALIVRATLGTLGEETQRAIANIHAQAVFWGSFAARNLPRGVMAMGAPAGLAALALAAGVAVGAMGAWRAWGVPVALPPRSQALLLASGTVIAGCFLAGENIEYRAVLLLPAVPALLALPATRATGWLAAAVMWEPLARRLVQWQAPVADEPPALPGLVLWALHNLAWWWLAGVLLALVLGQLRHAPGMALFTPWATARQGIR